MELIKDQSTIYEAAVVPLLINATIIEQHGRDVGMLDQFIIVY